MSGKQSDAIQSFFSLLNGRALSCELIMMYMMEQENAYFINIFKVFVLLRSYKISDVFLHISMF